MRYILPLFILFAIAVPFQVNANTAPKLMVVQFHADWCGSCAKIEPQLDKARGKADLDNKDVLFVKLDLTNGTTRNQSALLASAVGLGDFYKENNGKTGFVLLVDGATGEHLGKITKEHDSGKIIELIQSKL